METTPVFTSEHLLTRTIISDPYPVYQQLREDTPATRQTGSYLIFGFSQLPLVLSD